MTRINIKELDRKRFNVLVGHSRQPSAAYISEEIEWYGNEDETLIGVLLRDIVDNDFVGIVLARDGGGRFRTFDIESCIASREDARTWLVNALKWHTSMGVARYVQGDEQDGLDLFKPRVPVEKMHPSFVLLNSDNGYFPARSLLRELMPHLVDIDGNFVEQFQSSGFDSRLWELYLLQYLVEEGFYLDRSHSSPDFLVTKEGSTIAIEGVIVGRRENNPARYFKPIELELENSQDALDVMAIKFGSPLFSKLQKKYWELPHVASRPFVVAIADFHDDQSMLWSSTALISYLYGVFHEVQFDAKGKLAISPQRITIHQVGDKAIPSGYFFQEGVENISAVLFSQSGTLSKFNRLGQQAGFKDQNVRMFRLGTCHDHNPNAAVPKTFRYEINENCDETWAEGLSMFHNPNAAHPVPEELLPSIAHHRFRNGQIISHIPPFHPYGSLTCIMKIRD